jgi:hypothetical protein
LRIQESTDFLVAVHQQLIIWTEMMNKEKTGIRTRYVENLMGSKATQKLIQAIEEKNNPPERKTKKHCVSNEHAIDETTSNQEEQRKYPHR